MRPIYWVVIGLVALLALVIIGSMVCRWAEKRERKRLGESSRPRRGFKVDPETAMLMEVARENRDEECRF